MLQRDAYVMPDDFEWSSPAPLTRPELRWCTHCDHEPRSRKDDGRGLCRRCKRFEWDHGRLPTTDEVERRISLDYEKLSATYRPGGHKQVEEIPTDPHVIVDMFDPAPTRRTGPLHPE